MWSHINIKSVVNFSWAKLKANMMPDSRHLSQVEQSSQNLVLDENSTSVDQQIHLGKFPFKLTSMGDSSTIRIHNLSSP